MTSPSVPLETRFWQRVQKSDGCWLWTAALAAVNSDGDGYGHLAYQGRHLNAHRLSWELHNGPIPAGMHVLHRCDVRRCVRPDHLFLGTHADNMADAATKGRMHPRELNGMSRLTTEAVRIIRRDYTGKRGELGVFARRFGVSDTAVGLAVRGKTWTSA